LGWWFGSPSPSAPVIGWVLDQGVAGVMLPRIESAEEAKGIRVVL
jgi:2-keto-3-deoxy-L-rhamnonate aldolase RhmA